MKMIFEMQEISLAEVYWIATICCALDKYCYWLFYCLYAFHTEVDFLEILICYIYGLCFFFRSRLEGNANDQNLTWVSQNENIVKLFFMIILDNLS